MKKPVWIEKEALLLLHARSIARFGGAEGIRDDGLLESALTRAQNIYRYEPGTDIPSLAATYAWGISQNHPFLDGNKRAAFLCIGLFLESNGWRLAASPSDAISAMMALASGKIGEAEFTAWLKVNAHKAR